MVRERTSNDRSHGPWRAALRRLAWMVLGVIAVGAGGCKDKCRSEFPFCEGRAITSCGEEDQVFNIEEKRSLCFAENPVCVSAGAHPFCARSAVPSCTPSDDKRPVRCDGEIELTCREGNVGDGGPGGFEVEMDCRRVHSSTEPPGSYTCVPMLGCRPKKDFPSGGDAGSDR